MKRPNPLHVIDPALLTWITGGRISTGKGTDPKVLAAFQQLTKSLAQTQQQKAQSSSGMMQQMMQMMGEKKGGGSGGGKGG